MVFSSILFMFIYLPVVLFLYYISPVRWRNPILFLANLVFYGWGEPVFIVLMLFSITINYINGMLIGRWKLEKQKRAKAVLAINVVINLALLGFFKYYDLIAGRTAPYGKTRFACFRRQAGCPSACHTCL